MGSVTPLPNPPRKGEGTRQKIKLAARGREPEIGGRRLTRNQASVEAWDAANEGVKNQGMAPVAASWDWLAPLPNPPREGGGNRKESSWVRKQETGRNQNGGRWWRFSAVVGRYPSGTPLAFEASVALTGLLTISGAGFQGLTPPGY